MPLRHGTQLQWFMKSWIAFNPSMCNEHIEYTDPCSTLGNLATLLVADHVGWTTQ